jgi:predicted O-methyltransferase YrrM
MNNRKVLKFTTQIKLYRKLRYRKGYGVHSPFTYNLITKVIEERTPYYVFDDIENFRKELLAAEKKKTSVTAKETQHKNYGALLFRLVNFFKCNSVLQIKGTTGIMSLYLSQASRNCACFVLEDRPGLLKSVESYVNRQQLKNLHFLEGDYAENLDKLKSGHTSFDLIFINQSGNPKKTVEAIKLSQDFIQEKSVLIIDGIARNKAMKDLWKRIKNHPETRVTIDLYALGIVFFDTKLHKQNYKNYFDYGKKHDLYEKRRRRIHFVGWRKKGSQNQFAN